jgi:predicted ATP-dependent endonuclease of OLD family
MRRSRPIYNWDDDFPKERQSRRGQSVFNLVFDLDEEDRAAFRAEINSEINNELPLQITVGRGQPSFLVRKRGPGAQGLTEKSRDIARFIGRRIELNHIEAVRKAEDAQAVVDSVVSQALSQVEESDELREALDTVARLQRPVLDDIQESLAASLKQFLPSVKSVSIAPSRESRASALRSVDIHIDDGQLTTLSQKGDGVISLTALALLTGTGFDESKFGPSRRRSTSTVLAIEEPESHLHPTAIHYIRQAID